MFDNRPTETQYFYTDADSQGIQLEGQHLYAVTFREGQLPPVNGFRRRKKPSRSISAAIGVKKRFSTAPGNRP
jgi:hypothetical protein